MKPATPEPNDLQSLEYVRFHALLISINKYYLMQVSALPFEMAYDLSQLKKGESICAEKGKYGIQTTCRFLMLEPSDGNSAQVEVTCEIQNKTETVENVSIEAS
jgi:hypothetical protein